MPDRSINVFFYGLFMDESLLASKGIRPTDSAPGYVEGFRLCIGERATLLPARDSRAYGVMMRVTAEQAEALYSEESVRDYRAESVVVNLPGNLQRSAVCYNLPASKLAGKNPGYAAELLALAARLGMPESYLDRIRAAGREA